MTDKEYIETIPQRSTSYLLDKLDSYGHDSYYRQLYNATMSELVKRAMWYKVEDKLPEYNKIVLVAVQFWNGATYRLASLHNSEGKSWWRFDTDSIVCEDDIIAWTYIPLYKK